MSEKILKITIHGDHTDQRAADHIYKREGFSDAYRDAARARDDSRDALIIATRK